MVLATARYAAPRASLIPRRLRAFLSGSTNNPCTAKPNRGSSWHRMICAGHPRRPTGRAGFPPFRGSRSMSPSPKPLTPSATEPATPLEQLQADRAGLTRELAALNTSAARLRETAASTAAVLAEIDELG